MYKGIVHFAGVSIGFGHRLASFHALNVVIAEVKRGFHFQTATNRCTGTQCDPDDDLILALTQRILRQGSHFSMNLLFLQNRLIIQISLFHHSKQQLFCHPDAMLFWLWLAGTSDPSGTLCLKKIVGVDLLAGDTKVKHCSVTTECRNHYNGNRFDLFQKGGSKGSGDIHILRHLKNTSLGCVCREYRTDHIHMAKFIRLIFRCGNPGQTNRAC